MNVAPHRHHRSSETGPLCSTACLRTRARMVWVSSAVTESCKSDNSEVTAASSECSPITMRWVDQEVDIGTRGVFAT